MLKAEGDDAARPGGDSAASSSLPVVSLTRLCQAKHSDLPVPGFNGTSLVILLSSSMFQLGLSEELRVWHLSDVGRALLH